MDEDDKPDTVAEGCAPPPHRHRVSKNRFMLAVIAVVLIAVTVFVMALIGL
jgi:hypothetical protein